MQTRAADNVSADYDWLDKHSMNPVGYKVFTHSCVQNIMVALRKRMKTFKDMQQERVNQLNKQVNLIEKSQGRLYKAIETGTVQLDETM